MKSKRHMAADCRRYMCHKSLFYRFSQQSISKRRICNCRGGVAPPAGYNDTVRTLAGVATAPLQLFYAAIFILYQPSVFGEGWHYLVGNSMMTDSKGRRL